MLQLIIWGTFFFKPLKPIHPIIIDSTCLDLGLMFPNINHIFIALSLHTVYIFIAPQKNIPNLSLLSFISISWNLFHEVSSLGSWTVSLGEVFFGVCPPLKMLRKITLISGNMFLFGKERRKVFQHPNAQYFQKKTCYIIFCHTSWPLKEETYSPECLLVLRWWPLRNTLIPYAFWPTKVNEHQSGPTSKHSMQAMPCPQCGEGLKLLGMRCLFRVLA